MYLNLALSGSLSLTPHIAKSFSGYVLCSMVAAGNAVPMANTHAGPSGRGTNRRDATFAFFCTGSMITSKSQSQEIDERRLNSPLKPNAKQQ
jgi:hypothetical protein